MKDIEDMPETPPEEKAFESEEEQYETTPEEATGFGNALNRKLLLKIIVLSLSGIVLLAMLFNIHKGKNTTTAQIQSATAKTPESLKRDLENAKNRKAETPAETNALDTEDAPEAAQPAAFTPPPSARRLSHLSRAAFMASPEANMP